MGSILAGHLVQGLESESHFADIRATMLRMNHELPRAKLESGISSTDPQTGVSMNTVSFVMLLYSIALAGALWDKGVSIS